MGAGGYVCLALALLGLGFGLYQWYSGRRTLRRLDEMLSAAVDGSFRENAFDESVPSALEAKLARFLNGSASSTRNLEREREVVQTLISDISHQTRTPIANILLYASLLALPVPFQPVHLLFINLLTDSLPAIAIGMEPARKGLLDQKPRDPREPILNRPLLARIGGQGLLIAIVTMIAFYLGYQGGDAVMASTMAFATLTLARLFHGFNCRGSESIFRLKLSTNKYSVLAFLAGVVLLLLVLFTPGLKSLFMVAPAFGFANLGEIVLLAFLPTLVIQLVKLVCDARRGK